MSSACSPVERLMQTLRVEAPGATDAVIQLALFNVIDEFLRRTSAWKFDQELMLEQGMAEYPLALPADSAMVRLLAINHNSVPVRSASTTKSVSTAFARLAPEETFPDGDTSYLPAESDLAGGIFTYAIYRPDYITVTGVDEEISRYPLKMQVALSIAKSCMECECGDWMLEDWMYDMYFQDWLDGALARLMSMKGKPWTDTTLAGYHHKRFRNSMGYRKQEAFRGFSYDTPTWRFPRSWAR